ncbi:hypothetical protein GRJ2_002669200 [Grus japonensis]|uniref:Uncharacterized protein n=1 Tax=Grus japonensis TaxID=30415 RepID=A0ABC9XXE4_GRUJA
MGIGGKINRPRTELKKKLFKRRRVLARGGRQQKRRLRSVSRDKAPPLWGKRRRKMLKRLRVAARQGLEAEGAGGKEPETGPTPDVEMEEAAPAGGGRTGGGGGGVTGPLPVSPPPQCPAPVFPSASP